MEVQETLWLAKGKTILPFAKQLQIRCRGQSIPVERALCDFGSERVYVWAAKQMKEHCGIEVPTSQVVKCCMDKAGELVAEENLQPASLLPREGSCWRSTGQWSQSFSAKPKEGTAGKSGSSAARRCGWPPLAT